MIPSSSASPQRMTSHRKECPAAMTLFLLLVSAVGCSDSTGPEPTVNPVDVADTVKLIDDTKLSLASIADSTYTYDVTGVPPVLAPGDVIVSSSGDGYLRKIVDVKTSGTQLVLRTTGAGLDEVFRNASVRTILRLSDLQWEPEKGDDATTHDPYEYLAEGVSVDGDLINLNGLEIFKGVEPDGDVEVSARIETGYVRTDPVLDLEFKMVDSKVEKLHAIATDKTTFECTAVVTAEGSWGPWAPPAKKIFSKKSKPKVTMVGWVPVVTVVRSSGYIGFWTGVAAEAEARYTSRTVSESRMGVVYANGEWGDPIWEGTISHEPPEITFEAVAEVVTHVYYRYTVGVYVYDLAGPYLQLEPYLEHVGTLTLEGIPPIPTWCDGFYVGCDAGCGGEVRVFGKRLARLPALEFPLLRFQIAENCRVLSGQAIQWPESPGRDHIFDGSGLRTAE